MKGSSWSLAVVLGLAAGIVASDVAKAWQDDASGQTDDFPPLTEETVGKVAWFYQWGLGIKLSQSKLGQIRQELIASWKRRDPAEVGGAMRIVHLHDEAVQQSEAERLVLREIVQLRLVEFLRRARITPLVQSLLHQHESANAPIAPGAIPLTRRASDAFLQLIAFVSGEVAGKRGHTPSRVELDDFAGRLAGSYAEVELEGQQQIALMPLYLAAARASWQVATPAERARYRAEWTNALLGVQSGDGRREPAVTSSQGERRPTTDELGRRIRDDHKYYMSTMNLSMNTFYTNINSMNAIAGVPWRYSP